MRFSRALLGAAVLVYLCTFASAGVLLSIDNFDTPHGAETASALSGSDIEQFSDTPATSIGASRDTVLLAVFSEVTTTISSGQLEADITIPGSGNVGVTVSYDGPDNNPFNLATPGLNGVTFSGAPFIRIAYTATAGMTTSAELTVADFVNEGITSIPLPAGSTEAFFDLSTLTPTVDLTNIRALVIDFNFQDGDGTFTVSDISTFDTEVCGNVFEDCDFDNVQDAGEADLAGIEVSFALSSSPTTIIDTTNTDSNGDYCLSGVLIENYQFCVDDTVYVGVNPSTSCQTVAITVAGDVGDVDFGMADPTPPSDVTVECSSDTGTANTGTACGATSSDASDGNTCPEIITRTWTFGVTTADQIITVIDTMIPTIDTPAADAGAPCNSDGSDITAYNAWVAASGGATASDNCVTPTADAVTETIASGCLETQTIDFTFSDECGNQSAPSSATFTIEDNVPPSWALDMPMDLTVLSSAGGEQAAYDNWVNTEGGGSASDDCAVVVYTNDASATAPLCSLTGTLVTFSASDGCNADSTASATFTVTDDETPIVTCPADISVVHQAGSCDAPVSFSASFTDNCGAGVVEEYTTGGSVITSGHVFPEGTATVTYTATDEAGNEGTCSFDVTVRDDVDPTFVANSATVPCESADAAAWVATQDALCTDTCATTTTVTDNFSGPPDDCDTIEVTFVCSDNNGQSVTSTATYTTIDNTDPVWDVAPQNVSEDCAVADPSAWITSNGNGGMCTDNCEVDLMVSDNFSALTSFCEVVPVTFTCADDCGNFATSDATYTITDTTAPVITGLTDESIECTGTAADATALNTFLTNRAGSSATDDCSSIITYSDVETPPTGCPYITTLAVTYTDECGNAASGSATFTIDDTVDPTIVTPATPVSVACDGAGNTADFAAFIGSNGGATASDVCVTPSVSVSPSAGPPLTGCFGPTSYTFTFSDECGNTASSSTTFEVTDTVPPTITAAADFVAECDGSGNTAEHTAWLSNTGGHTATDNCGTVTASVGAGGFVASPVDCTTFDERTFTFEDECGLTSSVTTSFIIDDTTDPSIDTAAASPTVECGPDPTAGFNAWVASNGGAIASDDCTASLDETNNSSGLAVVDACTTAEEVTFTFTDLCGNSASTMGTYTVEDTMPPTYSPGASNLPVECGPGAETSYNNWLATFGGAMPSEACSTATPVGNDATAFPALPDGSCSASETVSFAFVDDCGNLSTTVATFSVSDTTAPVIDRPPSDLEIECDPDTNDDDLDNWLEAGGAATLIEACTDSSDIVITNSPGDVTSFDDCRFVHEYTFTFSDSCGLSVTSAVVEYRIVDEEPPVVTTPPQDASVECDGAGNTAEYAAWLADPAAVFDDVCNSAFITDVSGAGTFVPGAGGCSASSTVSFVVFDDCGSGMLGGDPAPNFASAGSATFTINDTAAPTLTTPAADSDVDCDGNETSAFNDWVADAAGSRASDTCEGVTITPTSNASGLGATGDACVQDASVIFTYCDACDNCVDTAEVTFTVTDVDAPVITDDADDLDVECGDADAMSDYNNWLSTFGGSAALDTCSSVTATHNASGFPSIGTSCSVSETVTFTYLDDCMLSSDTVATFTVQDTTAPSIDTQPTDLPLECDSTTNPGAIQTWLDDGGNAVVSDCTSQSLAGNSPSAPSGNDCVMTQDYTFTFADGCGNSVTSATATVTITDSVDPTTTAAQDASVECDGAGNTAAFAAWLADPSLVRSDACSATTITATAPTSGTSGPSGCYVTQTADFTVSDVCGNTASAGTATFEIQDTAAPVVSGAMPGSVDCDGGHTAAFNAWVASAAGATGADVCDGAVTSSMNDASGLSATADPCVQTADVTFDFCDSCGNCADTGAITFTVTDVDAPVITDDADDMDVECGDADAMTDYMDWLSTFGGSAAMDTCSSVTATHNASGFPSIGSDCSASETVTFTYMDACMLTSTTQATFTVEDTMAPSITAQPTDLTRPCNSASNPGEFSTWLGSAGGATATDACIGTPSHSAVAGGTTSSSVPGTSCTEDVSYTFVFTDDCGNTVGTNAASFITVDSVPPSIDTAATSPTPAECDSTNAGYSTWLSSHGGSAASDVCSSATVTPVAPLTIPSPFPCPFTHEATFTYTDACGLTSSTTGTYTIADTVAPTFLMTPMDDGVECGSGDAAAYSAWIMNHADSTAADDCVTPTPIPPTNSGLSSGCNNSETVSFGFSDDCGNMISQTATFTISDTTPPAWSPAPMSTSVDLSDGDPTAAYTAWLTANGGGTPTDDCASPTVTDDNPTFDPCGDTTVVFTVSDGCGATADVSASATFTANDDVPPTSVCPNDIVMTHDAGVCTFTYNYVIPAQSDNCGGTITTAQSHPPGTAFPIGVTTVTITATDANGNDGTPCTFTVTVDDGVGAVFNPAAPADRTEPCTTGFTIDDWLAADAGVTCTEACNGGTLTITNDYSGDFMPICDDVEVTFSCTGASGDTITAAATFTITDPEGPTLTLPGDVTVDCDAAIGSPTVSAQFAAWVASASATDNCSSAGQITINNDSSGITNGCSDSTTVTWTATDDCGVVTTDSDVFAVEDVDAPDWGTNTPMNDDAPLSGGSASVQAAYTAWLTSNGSGAATDACTSVMYSHNGPASISDCDSVEVTFVAEDGCSNVAAGQTATFTSADDVAPMITCPPDEVFFVGADCMVTLTDSDFSPATASDNCALSGTPSPSLVGTFTVGEYTNTFMAMDTNGNTASCTQAVSIRDNTDPFLFNAGADDFGTCDSAEYANFLSTNGGTVCNDNCTPETSIVYTNDGPAIIDDCTTVTVTFTCTDVAGNSLSTDLEFVQTDPTAPMITVDAQDQTVTCQSDGSDVTAFNDWVAAAGNSMATDNCATLTAAGVTTSPSTPAITSGCFDSESVVFTWTDNCGQSSTTSGTFIISDTIPPAWNTNPSDDSITTSADEQAAYDAWRNSRGNTGVATDDCSTVTYTDNGPAVVACGTNVVTFTALDSCSQTSTRTATFFVADNVDPTITCPADITVNNDANNCNALVTYPVPSGMDDCGVASVMGVFGSGSVFPVGTTTETLTVTDTNGQTNTCSFDITVNDVEDPAISCFGLGQSVGTDPGECFASVTFAAPVPTDNCAGVGVTLTQGQASGSGFVVGTTTQEFTATDSSGNQSSCTFNINVADNEDPTFSSCPGSFSVPVGVPFNYVVVADDNCDATVGLVKDFGPDPTDSASTVGPVNVQFTATDAGGLTAVCAFTINVVAVDPILSPSLTVNIYMYLPTEVELSVDFLAVAAAAGDTLVFIRLSDSLGATLVDSETHVIEQFFMMDPIFSQVPGMVTLSAVTLPSNTVYQGTVTRLCSSPFSNIPPGCAM